MASAVGCCASLGLPIGTLALSSTSGQSMKAQRATLHPSQERRPVAQARVRGLQQTCNLRFCPAFSAAMSPPQALLSPPQARTFLGFLTHFTRFCTTFGHERARRSPTYKAVSTQNQTLSRRARAETQRCAHRRRWQPSAPPKYQPSQRSHVGPKPLAAIAARHRALFALCSALSCATHEHTFSQRAHSNLSPQAAFEPAHHTSMCFQEEVVGYKEQLRTRPPRHEAQPAAAALKCLSTTPHSSPAQRRTVEIRTLSRVSAPQPATTAHVLTSHHASGDGSSNSSALVCSAALCCSAANAVLRVVRDEDAADLGHESARERAAASVPLLEPSFDV